MRRARRAGLRAALPDGARPLAAIARGRRGGAGGRARGRRRSPCVAVGRRRRRARLTTPGACGSASIVNSVALNGGRQPRGALRQSQPFWWYGLALVALSGGLAAGRSARARARLARELAAAGRWRRHSRGAFSPIGHKETRFVFMLTPMWLIGLAALTADRGALLAAAVPWHAPCGAGRRGGVLVRGLRGDLRARSLRPAPVRERRYLRPNIARNAAREAYRALAVRDRRHCGARRQRRERVVSRRPTTTCITTSRCTGR